MYIKDSTDEEGKLRVGENSAESGVELFTAGDGKIG